MAHKSRQMGHFLFCPPGINITYICYVHMHACTCMNECKRSQEGKHGVTMKRGQEIKRGGKSIVVIYLDEHLETIAYSLFKHRTAQNSERAAPEKVTSSQTNTVGGNRRRGLPNQTFLLSLLTQNIFFFFFKTHSFATCHELFYSW